MVRALLLDGTVAAQLQDGDKGRALVAAAGGGHTDVAQVLLGQAGVRADGEHGRAALAKCMSAKHQYPMVQLLVEAGAGDGEAVLSAAVRRPWSQGRILRLLLRRGLAAHPSQATRQLHENTFQGHGVQVVQWLLQAGADPRRVPLPDLDFSGVGVHYVVTMCMLRGRAAELGDGGEEDWDEDGDWNEGEDEEEDEEGEEEREGEDGEASD